MPIASDLTPRNFVTKILHYEKVVNIPNSMTVLDTLLPIALQLAEQSHVGTINFCNPGTIAHNDILQMYKDIIDPRFVFFVVDFFLHYVVSHGATFRKRNATLY